MNFIKRYFFYIIIIFIPLIVNAEDGSQLWLRQSPVSDSVAKNRTIEVKCQDKIALLAQEELSTYWAGQTVVLKLDRKLNKLKQGYAIKGDLSRVEIISAEPVGLLYGAYHLLRLQDIGADTKDLNIKEVPDYDIRILNHWDNLDRTVERGYAGYSLWRWDELPH